MGRNSGDTQIDSIGNFELKYYVNEKRWTLNGKDPRSKVHNPYDPDWISLSGTSKNMTEAKAQASKALKRELGK